MGSRKPLGGEQPRGIPNHFGLSLEGDMKDARLGSIFYTYGILWLGKKAAFKQYRGDDPLGFVLAANLDQRHLDESQRGMVAARISRLDKGANQYKARVDGKILPATTQAEAAKLLNVSRETVKAARVVQEKGSEPLVKAVEQGQIAVSAAKSLVDLTPKQQLDIIRNYAVNAALKKGEFRTPDRSQVATQTEAEEIVTKAGEFLALVEEWVGKNHPALKA